MALIDKASLLFVPSVVAEGKAFNVLPSGNRAPDSTDQNSGYDQTRADFDFDRGSNAAATRIGSDGLIKKYRENLLLQSNNFGTTWQTINASVTSGQSGYDGGSDAWLLTSTGGPLYQSISESGVVTFSVYAKANIGAGFLFRVDQTTQTKLEFNISTGAFISGSNYIDYNSTTIGGGWYRLSVTFLAASTSTAQFRITDGSGTNISGSAFIQSAQLESGLVATDYLDSTSVTGKAGVLVDLPRINYDANGENGSLLLEPQRANLLRHSEYFSFWVNNGASITTNSTTSPEGVQNASTITGVSGNNRIYLLETTTSGTTYTLSFYAKKGTSSTIGLDFINVSSGTTFNFDTKSWGTNAAWDLFDYEELDNGWFRLYGVIDSNTTSAGIGIYVESGETAYVFGAQLEAGSYPSSYIPNHGESGGVTRAADDCSVTGVSDVIGQSEGTLFVECEYERTSTAIGARKLISVNSGNSTNLVDIFCPSLGNNLTARVRANGGQFGAISISNAPTGMIKIAYAYKANDYALYINGTQYGTDTTGGAFTFSSSVNIHQIGDGEANGDELGGGVKQAALFKERLSNAELATLTTL